MIKKDVFCAVLEGAFGVGTGPENPRKVYLIIYSFKKIQL